MAMPLSHARAVVLMVLVTLLWSIAGVVTRQVQGVSGSELSFWRSGVNALALVVLLVAWRGRDAVLRTLRGGGVPLWVSGLCWATMFSAFMLALGLTSVANVRAPGGRCCWPASGSCGCRRRASLPGSHAT
jgi:drug/metabolite transporter (DMT)-like permease